MLAMKKVLDHGSAMEGFVAGSKVLVVGLGATGLSCVRYLVGRGLDVVVTDSRELPPGLNELSKNFPAVPVYPGRFVPELFKDAEQIVVSPGVALQEPLITDARCRNVVVVGDIELFARAARAPVIAITGSNGKSTVTSLVAHMADQEGREIRVGGNLGTPALDLLQDVEPDLYVLELSSFQLESTFNLRAQAAVVLNVSADHMDRYRSVTEYAAAKARIYNNAKVQVVNTDDPLAKSLAEPGITTVQFGVQDSDQLDYGLGMHNGDEWLTHNNEELMQASELRLAGRHNLSNALAALALGACAGLPMQHMLRTLRSFEGLPHRMQWVAEQDGICWYNDSKATNIGATVAAITGMDRPVVLIAGGDAKGADFEPLRQALGDRVRAVVVLGRDALKIRDALQSIVCVVNAGDIEEAVTQAARLARAGDAVLLSPACASFDMFSGYEERGQVFMEAVRCHLA